MKNTLCAVAALVVFLVGATASFATETRLYPVSDTYVAFDYENGPTNYTPATDFDPSNGDGTSYSDLTTLITGYHGNYWNALIQFDLSSIPSTATINDATLSLMCIGSTGTGDDYTPTFTIHDITRSWNEDTVVYSGDLGGTDNIYFNYIAADRWQLGNNNFFNPTAIAQGQLGNYPIPLEFNLTATATQWQTGNNYGILLKEGTLNNFGSIFFASSENDWLYFVDDNYFSVKPTLRINYTDGSGNTTVPEPATMALFGIGSASMAFARRKKKAS
ncbi:MAG: DNRLRE domain-containing protein [Candidatus Omnitrophica bacterium]|nr:DNRLRE domain-containing protein [Candidatus Omnitrophota bacterium]